MMLLVVLFGLCFCTVYGQDGSVQPSVGSGDKDVITPSTDADAGSAVGPNGGDGQAALASSNDSGEQGGQEQPKESSGQQGGEDQPKESSGNQEPSEEPKESSGNKQGEEEPKESSGQQQPSSDEPKESSNEPSEEPKESSGNQEPSSDEPKESSNEPSEEPKESSNEPTEEPKESSGQQGGEEEPNGSSGDQEDMITGDCGNGCSFVITDGSMIVTGDIGDYSENNKAPWHQYKEKIIILGFGGDEDEETLKRSGAKTTRIGNYAFYDLTSLTTVNIPKSVTSIGSNAFLGTAVSVIVYEGESDPCGENVKIVEEGKAVLVTVDTYTGETFCGLPVVKDGSSDEPSEEPKESSGQQGGDEPKESSGDQEPSSNEPSEEPKDSSDQQEPSSDEPKESSNEPTEEPKESSGQQGGDEPKESSGQQGGEEEPKESSGDQGEDENTGCGQGCSFKIEGGKLIIEGDITDYSTSKLAPWHSKRSEITSIQFATSAPKRGLKRAATRKIGAFAFYQLTEVTSVEIPSTISSIGNNAFQGCSKLATVNIKSISITFGNAVFAGCPITSFAFAGAENPCTTQSIFDSGLQIKFTLNDDYTASEFCGYRVETNGPASSSTAGEQKPTESSDGSEGSDSNKSDDQSSSEESSGQQGGEEVVEPFKLEGNKLTITIVGEMPNYTPESPAPWHKHRKVIKEVKFVAPKTGMKMEAVLTSIGDYAFYELSEMTSIEIPGTVTKIGKYAFKGCTSLKEVSIPGSVKSIGTDAFVDCDSLKSVTFNGKTDPCGNVNLFGDQTNTTVYVDESLSKQEKFCGSTNVLAIPTGGNKEDDDDDNVVTIVVVVVVVVIVILIVIVLIIVFIVKVYLPRKRSDIGHYHGSHGKNDIVFDRYDEENNDQQVYDSSSSSSSSSEEKKSVSQSTSGSVSSRSSSVSSGSYSGSKSGSYSSSGSGSGSYSSSGSSSGSGSKSSGAYY